jgi:MoaA/NifB/PqqE/SkfB family radical SAM enzyme
MKTSLPLAENKAFCALPWVHLAVFPEGSVKLCCVARSSVHDNDAPLSLNEYSLDEIWNSAYMRGVRRDMLAGKHVADCSACYVAEKTGHTSRRVESNVRWAAELGPLFDRLIAESRCQDHGAPALPLYYQLMPGNLCNLKCRMCFPVFSSQIEKDPVHSKWAPVLLDTGRTWQGPDWTAGRVALAPAPLHGVRLDGFHQLEEPDGAAPFRWTNGRASVALALPPGARPESVRVRLRRRHHRGQRARVWVNGVAMFDGSLPWWRALDRTFPITAATAGELTVRVESDTFRAEGDPRELGVAVEAIELTHAPVHEAHEPTAGRPSGVRLPSGPWYRDDAWVRDVLLQNADQLRALYFTGGEPLLEKQVEHILEHLIERGVAGHIDIELNSNCTALREPVMEKLQQFRTVNLTLSIDSAGPYYEYIRYPARWETIRRNVDRLRAMSGPRFKLLGGIVLQVYNALNLTQILEFLDERQIPFIIDVATSPSFLAISVLPKRVREVAAARLDEYAAKRCRPEQLDVVRTTAARLRSIPDRSTPENLRTLMLFSNDLDITRNQSARTVHGELLDMLRAEGFHWTDELSLAKAA